MIQINIFSEDRLTDIEDKLMATKGEVREEYIRCLD